MSPEVPAGSSDPLLEPLHAITRQMATADHFDTVLHSITRALVERAAAVVARVFLLMYDHECPVCRERIGRGEEGATDERVLHLVAEAGAQSERGAIFHRVPLDAVFLAAQVVRTRTPVLVEDWHTVQRFRGNAVVSQL